jgi:hypothetical protein
MIARLKDVKKRTFRAFAVRLTGFEAIEELIMPIRIRCRDKTLDRQNVIETKGLKTSSSAYPMAAYADRNPALRIFSRSA